MAIGIKIDGSPNLKNIKIDGRYLSKVKVDGVVVWKRDNWVDKTGEIARRDIPVKTNWIPWAGSTSNESWCEVLSKQTVELGKKIRIKEVTIHCDMIRTEPSPWNPDWSFTMAFRNASTGEWIYEYLSADQPDLKYGFSQTVSSSNQSVVVDAYQYWGSIFTNPKSKHDIKGGYLSVTKWQEEGA